MFDKQMLYDRRMTVRMDRGVTDKTEVRLPEGLKSIGVGLGPNGEPLRDVARNLPQNSAPNNLNLANAGSTIGGGVLGAVPTASVALNGLGTGLAANPLGTNAALSGSLGLQVSSSNDTFLVFAVQITTTMSDKTNCHYNLFSDMVVGLISS